MTHSTILNLAAITLLIGPLATFFRKNVKRDSMYWIAIVLATLCSFGIAFSRVFGAWQVDFSSALWVTIATVMIVFCIANITNKTAWRLSPIICIYMSLLAILALFSNKVPVASLDTAYSTWVYFHIFTSLLTYSLVTIAAVSAVAAVLQETALKTKRKGHIISLLPSLVDSDQLTKRYLVFGEIILGLGLLTGISINWITEKVFLNFDHKTILTISAFLTIAIVLWIQQRTGLRGRQAARIILVAYLLLTLGYLGVKFVTDVLLV